MNQGGTFTNSNSILNVHQDQNTFAFSPIQEHNLLNFSPNNLLDHDVFHFSSISSLPYQTPTPPPPPPSPPLPPSEKEKRKAVVAGPKGSARRTGKKDRHSKIHTAQGPRDRRMRLSLQIARKFFDLQDMLGFDKASKTIDWLFNKSKAAIKDLAEKSCTTTRFLNTPSTPSEDGGGGVREVKIKKPTMETKGVPRTKESRAKAREWARERTKEKLLKKKGVKSKEVLQVEQNPNRVIRVDNNNNNHQIMEQHPLEDQMASVGIIEKFLAASSSSSNSHFHHDCDNQRRSFAGEQMAVRPYGGVCYEDLPENWATENNARLSHFVQSPNYGFLSRDYNQGI